MSPSRVIRSIALHCLVGGICLLSASRLLAEKPVLPDPTPEELSMTSQPQVPGAPAVILYHEEKTDSLDGTFTVTSSIKILNQEGRDKYSVVAVTHPSSRWTGLFSHTTGTKVMKITARTVHADGSIVPFTGKPYERDLVLLHDRSAAETVFSLPDVQVGSIVQYQYTLRSDDISFVPVWFTQNALFARHEHYAWHTALRDKAYSSFLPGGPAAVTIDTKHDEFFADVTNVMPAPDEPFMPPIQSFAPRVVFYTILNDDIRTTDDFWKVSGNIWSTSLNQFIGQPSALKKQAQEIVQGASTDDEKLRKLYAAVMQFENTRFTTERSAVEDKAAGMRRINKAADVLNNKRGNDDELALLFIALARSLGFKAYAMAVTDRDRGIFVQSWLSYSQLDDIVAIVQIGGKDIFLDPGQKFCPFGQMKWTHEGVGGLRQTPEGTAFATTPVSQYKEFETERIADLTLEKTGAVSGHIVLRFHDGAALPWRQASLGDDRQTLNKDLQDTLQADLPAEVIVTLQSIEGMESYEGPLTVRFSITGQLGANTSKRLILPGQLFMARTQNPFTAEKRETYVYFKTPERFVDAVRYRLPEGLTAESQPATQTFTLPQTAFYKSNAEVSSNAITMRRDSVVGVMLVPPAGYPALKKFYSQTYTADQTPLVLLANKSSNP